MAKSKKPKPEPKKSPSPAKSSPGIPESEEPKSPPGNPTAEVLDCPPKNSSPPPREDFESYYLKQVTAEFADDIDKLRSAPDFSEQSVPVVIQALKQGAKGYSEEEKEEVMKGK